MRLGRMNFVQESLNEEDVAWLSKKQKRLYADVFAWNILRLFRGKRMNLSGL